VAQFLAGFMASLFIGTGVVGVCTGAVRMVLCAVILDTPSTRYDHSYDSMDLTSNPGNSSFAWNEVDNGNRSCNTTTTTMIAQAAEGGESVYRMNGDENRHEGHYHPCAVWGPKVSTLDVYLLVLQLVLVGACFALLPLTSRAHRGGSQQWSMGNATSKQAKPGHPRASASASPFASAVTPLSDSESDSDPVAEPEPEASVSVSRHQVSEQRGATTVVCRQAITCTTAVM